MAATDYRKPQDQLIYDLIEESNPGFKAAYPLGSLQFTNMTAITVDSADPYKRDTQVVCSGKTGSGVTGRVTVKYRRINLSTMFKNMSVVLTDWLPSNITILPRATWTASLAAKYGLSVVDADWNATYGGMTVNAVQPTLSVNSLCYTGGITGIVWKRGKQPMSNMIPDNKQVLVGRLYPGGNDFSNQSRKPVGEWQLYGLDASEIKSTIEGFAASTAVAVNDASAPVVALLNWLKANSGKTNWSTADSSVDGGIGGLTWYRYSLPSVSVPEGNTSRFNRALVIQSTSSSWFSGKLILHYNA